MLSTIENLYYGTNAMHIPHLCGFCAQEHVYSDLYVYLYRYITQKRGAHARLRRHTNHTAIRYVPIQRL